MNPAILELSTDISGFVNPRLLVDVAFPGIAFSGGSDILYPRTNEVVYCNINEYLASAYADIESLSKTFTFPDYLKDWTEVEGFCKKYEIHIRERSDDGPNDVDLNITNRYVLPGVIPSWKKDLFYSQYASFWDWLNTKKTPFLTFAPKSLPTTQVQTQKLYWLCNYVPEAGHTIDIKIKLYFEDGSTGEFWKSAFKGILKQFSVYQFHVGYIALGIENKVSTDFAGKIVDAYDVTAFDNLNAVSETRTYVLNKFEHVAEHELVFRNSPGVFDTIMLTGEASLEREHIPEIVRVHNPAINNPLQRIIRSDVKETVKASTGWLDNERRLYLAELLGSPEVYEIIRGKLYPVMMTKQTMIAARDNEELQAVNIDYEMVESFYVESGA